MYTVNGLRVSVLRSSYTTECHCLASGPESFTVQKAPVYFRDLAVTTVMTRHRLRLRRRRRLPLCLLVLEVFVPP